MCMHIDETLASHYCGAAESVDNLVHTSYHAWLKRDVRPFESFGSCLATMFGLFSDSSDYIVCKPVEETCLARLNGGRDSPMCMHVSNC